MAMENVPEMKMYLPTEDGDFLAMLVYWRVSYLYCGWLKLLHQLP